MTWTLRRATAADEAGIEALMARSMATLLPRYLNPAEVEASIEVMGLDRQIIADGTYFVAEEADRLIACGGWSIRGTLCGGDHSAGRDSRRLDPGRDAARVRAMYTDPAHVRRGLGRSILAACEAAARQAGYRRVELAATMPGQPLYEACGYAPINRMDVTASSGVAVPIMLMGKTLAPD